MMLLGSLPCFLSGLTVRIWGLSAAQCPEWPGRGRLTPVARGVLAKREKRQNRRFWEKRKKSLGDSTPDTTSPVATPTKLPSGRGLCLYLGNKILEDRGHLSFSPLVLFFKLFLVDAVPSCCLWEGEGAG